MLKTSAYMYTLCVVKCLLALADLRDYHGFEHKDLLDRTFGTAVRVMGPKVVLVAVPLCSQPSRSDMNVSRQAFAQNSAQHAHF